jgi:hypothetical protein
LVRIGTQPPRDGQTIQTREHDVENDGVEGMGQREAKSRIAVAGNSNLVPFLGKALFEEASHSGIIFGYEELHGLFTRLTNGPEGSLKNGLSDNLQVNMLR